jgi:hypothetical protein
MDFRKRRTIRRMERAIHELTSDLAAEQAINESLRKALVVASDPARWTSIEIDPSVAGDDAGITIRGIIQMPDGEYVAPSAYDWDTLARDIIAADETGGASGEW